MIYSHIIQAQLFSHNIQSMDDGKKETSEEVLLCICMYVGEIKAGLNGKYLETYFLIHNKVC